MVDIAGLLLEQMKIDGTLPEGVVNELGLSKHLLDGRRRPHGRRGCTARLRGRCADDLYQCERRGARALVCQLRLPGRSGLRR